MCSSFSRIMCDRFLRSGLRSLMHLAALFAICAGLLGNSMDAQTRFEDPHGTIDIKNYRNADQCWALVNRLFQDNQRTDSILDDTVPPGVRISSRMTPLPRHIIESTQRCTAQWTGSTASLEDFDVLGELFLAAGRKADFATLIRRKVAEADSNTKNGKFLNRDSATVPGMTFTMGKEVPVYTDANSVYEGAIEIYQNARPVHFAEIDSLVTYLVSLPDTAYSKEKKINRLLYLRYLAEVAGEPNVAMRRGMEIEALVTGLTDEDRRAQWYSNSIFASLIKRNSMFVHFQERIDSLEASGAAYVKLVQDQLRKVFLGVFPAPDLRFEVGAKSPSVEGDFWFPKKPTLPRPTVGKTSLVIALNQCRRDNWGGEMSGSYTAMCLGLFAMLQRIHQQFPDVEITILTNQEGRAILQEPGTAEDEAEDVRRFLLDGFQLPVTLAMEKADFVKLPKPDNRIVNTHWTLDEMHEWGCQSGAQSTFLCFMGAVLIDESGIVLNVFPVQWNGEGWRVHERNLVQMLTAMSRRKH